MDHFGKMDAASRARNIAELKVRLADYERFNVRNPGLWDDQVAATKRTIARLEAGGEFTDYELGRGGSGW